MKVTDTFRASIKNVITFFGILLVPIIFTSCSSASSSESASAIESFSTNPSASSYLPGSSSESSNKSFESPTPTPFKCDVEILESTNFSDGVAWVRYLGAEGSEIGLIDTSGEITSLSFVYDTDDFGADFSGGYSYINFTDRSDRGKTYEQFIIFDKTGTITARSPKYSNYTILAGGDGVFCVQQTLMDMTTNETRYGFMDFSGKWLLEPSANSPMSFNVEGRVKALDTRGFCYHGNHIFTVTYSGAQNLENHTWMYFYNVDTGVSKCYQDISMAIFTKAGSKPVMVFGADNCYFNSDPYTYYGGFSIAVANDKVYSINEAGELSPILNLDSYEHYSIYYHNGIVFCGLHKYSGSVSPLLIDSKFYSIDGKVLIDLSKYSMVQSDTTDLYRFYDNYAAIEILGADSNCYIALIDTAGNMIIEPVQCLYSSNYDYVSDFTGNAIVVESYQNENGQSVQRPLIIKSNGEIISLNAQISDYSSAGFYDGYLLIGNTYIDANGQKLAPYITLP